MKKEIRSSDDKLGLVRITTSDERWYAKAVSNTATGLPEFKALPSVTWIVSVYPKLGLQKLRDELGAEETDLLKKLGGERGSKVHEAITAIIQGQEVRVDSHFTNPTTGLPEELTAEEVGMVAAFVEWKKVVNPKFLTWDRNVYSEKYGFAGTLDAIAEIGGEVVLIDFKTSKVIGTDYEMQVSAYRAAIVSGENNEVYDAFRGRPIKIAILQLGTKPLKTNPATYRWREVEDCFDLFMATRKIWENVYETQVKDERGFSQKDYPIVLSPALTVEEVMAADNDSGQEVLPVAPAKASKKK
jgi:PD-(D/E)XK nuclease superfamily